VTPLTDNAGHRTLRKIPCQTNRPASCWSIPTASEYSPLSILFQDEWFIAVDKPAGQLVHPVSNPSPDDEVTMKLLRDQIGQKIYPIHRLDRPTSGALLFATAPDAAQAAHRLFENGEVGKIYLAIAHGHPAADSWTCRKALRKDPDAREQSAETSFRVRARFQPEPLALLEARPKTGRFHQIRRHLLDAGHPIVGDYRYAGIERSDKTGAQLDTGTRMLLQAKQLSFQHPVTRENVVVEAPTDPLIQQVCRRLAN